MTKHSLALVTGLLATTAFASSAAAQDARIFEVKIENLTTGQPMSPGIAVTHSRDVNLFQNGKTSSAGIIAIAEDGNPQVAYDALAPLAGVAGTGVSDVAVFFGDDAPPLFPIGGAGANTSTFMIEAGADANYLSFATMLICTNDGFTGIDSLRLPSTVVTKYGIAYDAGSEVNDYRSESIVDPCSGAGPVALAGDPNGNNNDLPEDGGRVRAFGQVGLGGDLLAAHRWQGQVVRVTVRQVFTPAN